MWTDFSTRFVSQEGASSGAQSPTADVHRILPCQSTLRGLINNPQSSVKQEKLLQWIKYNPKTMSKVTSPRHPEANLPGLR